MLDLTGALNAAVGAVLLDTGHAVSEPNGAGGCIYCGRHHEVECMAAFSASVRAACFPSSELDQAQQLASALRRICKRGVDPDFDPAVAAQFDDAIKQACRSLNEITRLLTNIRERVDLAKIRDERAARAAAWQTRGPRIAARAKRVPAGLSGKDASKFVAKAVKQLTAAERAELMALLRGEAK